MSLIKNRVIAEFFFLSSYVVWCAYFFNFKLGFIHPADAALIGFFLHLIGVYVGQGKLGGRELLKKINSKKVFFFVMLTFWLVFSTLWGCVALLNFWAIRTAEFDLGIFAQTLLYLSRGEGFLQFVQATSSGSYLQDHQIFTLPLFAPFFWTPWGTELLVFSQPYFLLAPGFLMSLWIQRNFPGKLNFRPLWGIFFMVLWLKSQPVINNILWDWHETTLSLGFLTFFTWAFFVGSFPFLILSSFLSGFTKEYLFLICGLVVILFPFFHFDKIKGNLLRSIALSTTLFLSYFIIQKLFAEKNYSTMLYAHLGSTPLEILKTLFIKPSIFWDTILSEPKKIEYFIKMNSYTGFISFLSGLYFLVSIPIWLIHLLSSRASQTMDSMHYALEVWAFISVISLFTVIFFLKKIPEKFQFYFFILVFSATLFGAPKNPFHYRGILAEDAKRNYRVTSQLRDELKDMNIGCNGKLKGIASMWTFSTFFREAQLYSMTEIGHLKSKKGFLESFVNLDTKQDDCLFFIGTEEDFGRIEFIIGNRWKIKNSFELYFFNTPQSYQLKVVY